MRKGGFVLRLCLVLLMGIGFVSLAGCTFLRIAMRNVPPSFRQPAKVKKLNRSDVPSGTRLSATWIGHSTVLIQMDDLYLLTDPVLTERVGFVSKRLVEPGMDLGSIPRLTAILISHRHFDHLSAASLKLLDGRVQTIVVPPDTNADLSKLPFTVKELATWQSFSTMGLNITAIPVIHSGGRLIHDSASHARSFTGFLIHYHGLSVYYPGDTAFRDEIFSEVTRRCGGVDLALLPIGPIEPPTVMERSHMNPAQAIQAAEILQAGMMLPVHFETFVNSLDAPTEDRVTLMQAEATAPASLKIVNWHIGESVVVR